MMMKCIGVVGAAAWLGLAGIVMSPPAHAAEKSPAPVAAVQDGNITLTPAGGGDVKTLTAGGLDSAPVVSPDGKWIVFVRAVPGKKIATGAGEFDAQELWQIDSAGKQPVRLVAPRDAEKVEDLIATFDHVQFSADGRLVYFVTPAWATSGAVHVVDTTTRKTRFVIAGDGLRVLRSGEYRDCLMLSQHRYFLGGGSFDWLWLFRPDGKEVGPVGEDATNFLELYCPDESAGNEADDAK